VTIGLATTISMPILADPLSDKLKSQKNQLAEQKAAYNQAKDKVEDIEGSIEKLDAVIEAAFAEIDKTKVKIGETEQQIDNTKKDIQVAEDNIKEEEELFNKRMRTMYMNGVDGYLEVLLSSEGIEDLISRVDNIKKIVEYDNKIIGELTDKKVKIEDQKAKLENEKGEELRTLYTQMMLERGFLGAAAIYPTMAHTDEIVQKYNQAIDEVFGLISLAIKQEKVDALLKGPVAHTGFRRLN